MTPRLIAPWLAMLVAGMLTAAPVLAADDGSVRVEYQGSKLSVSATDVGLVDVLRAIGAKVGFTVAETKAPAPTVSLSVEQASVDDVLRQLLRTENHTILYRQGPGAAALVDRIVLLGPPGSNDAVVVAGVPPASHPGPAPASPTQGAGAGPAVPAAAPVTPQLPDQPQSQDTVTVGDMLKTHALAGLPAQTAAGAGAPPAPDSAATQPGAAQATGGQPTTPAGLEETLAITTRRAQEGLSALVEGLERATRSLHQAPAAPAPGR